MPAAAPIFPVASLADDTFGAERTGLTKNFGAIGVEVLVVSDDAHAAANEVAQHRLALQQWLRRQRLAVQRDEIEGEVRELRPRLATLLQRLKAGDAPRVEHDELAIDRRAFRLQPLCVADELRIFVSVVRSATRIETDGSAGNHDADAVAVELQLMD